MDYAGKDASFDKMYKGYADRLIHYVFAIVKNRDDAEELAQEAFLKAYNAFGTFREKSKLSTWLFSIARNLAYNYIKRQRYEGNVSLDQDVSIGKGKERLAVPAPRERPRNQRLRLSRMDRHRDPPGGP